MLSQYCNMLGRLRMITSIVCILQFLSVWIITHFSDHNFTISKYLVKICTVCLVCLFLTCDVLFHTYTAFRMFSFLTAVLMWLLFDSVCTNTDHSEVVASILHCFLLYLYVPASCTSHFLRCFVVNGLP